MGEELKNWYAVFMNHFDGDDSVEVVALREKLEKEINRFFQGVSYA